MKGLATHLTENVEYQNPNGNRKRSKVIRAGPSSLPLLALGHRWPFLAYLLMGILVCTLGQL